MVAAAMADGKTRIEQENLIERGYENLVSVSVRLESGQKMFVRKDGFNGRTKEKS